MIPERVVGARVDVGERVDVGDRPGVEGVVGPSVTRDDEAAATRMGGRRMRMRRARSSASVAVVWSVVCAIGARATWGQMRPAPGDTYANSQYYIRDVGVEVSDLHGGKFCFAKEARHERPDIPEMFLPLWSRVRGGASPRPGQPKDGWDPLAGTRFGRK